MEELDIAIQIDEMKRSIKWIFLLIIIFVQFYGASGAVTTSRLFVGNGADTSKYHILYINDEMAQYTQRHCSRELIEIQKLHSYIDLNFPRMETAKDIRSVTARFRPRKAYISSSILLVRLEEELLRCLSKGKNLHVSSHLLEEILGAYVLPRRYLTHTSSSSQRRAASATPSPFPSLEQSSNAPSVSPYPRPKAHPVASGYPPPPPPKHKAPPLRSKFPPTPALTKLNSDTGPAKEDRKSDASRLIAVAAGVSGSVIVVALVIFFCAVRKKTVDPGCVQRDQSPLLTLSLGSSQNSDNNKDFGRTPFSHNSSGKLDVGAESVTAGHVSDGFGNNDTLPPLKFPPGRSAHPPAPPPQPPPPPPARPCAPPPPPSRAYRSPPMPPTSGRSPHQPARTASGEEKDLTADSVGPKRLKPFFWDKVLASPDHSMVWDEIREGSFQFNEAMIESLFGYASDDKRNGENRDRTRDASMPYVQIIDAKKSQNLSILLRALNVTTYEVSDALLEGNELPTELLQTMLRMQPTQEEELKLRLYSGDLSKLGPAERFLKALVDIPFAFKRMEALMLMMNMEEEVSTLKESFSALEVACNELKNSRLFLKLLEAVLKTGNRMNDGTFRGGAQAFKLDTLLKLSDVKGTDGKTTLLHFVVQEIVRTEGLRYAFAAKQNCSVSGMKSDDSVEDAAIDATEQYRTLGLQVVSGLSNELENVKKAAVIDVDTLASTVSKLGQSLLKSKDFLINKMQNLDEKDRFYEVLTDFIERSEGEITWLLEELKRISELVKKTTDYFHGSAVKEEGQRLFSIVRDFLILLDKICGELKNLITAKPAPSISSKISTETHSPGASQQAIYDMRKKLFPEIAGRRIDGSGSDSSSDNDD